MTVAGIVKSSLIDYPGLISCVLFTPGCNFDCFYCHNRTLIDESRTAIKLDEIRRFLKKRIGKLDGVVVTGGEPTLQPNLIDFLGELKHLGYKVKLDTNGSWPDIIERVCLSGLADYFAVDYKAPASRYKDICKGVADADKVLETIRCLCDRGEDFEVRTTVIPQLCEEDLVKMAQELPPLPRYVLNRYRKPEVFLPGDAEKVNMTPYTPEQIKAFAETIRNYQPNVSY